ncbi:Gti1/Pac2 family-domain-containing protein [Hypoxylon crocopeplum]|nr:Gti1/Pac2 family-domain-containing protein [Hypoxylon crocopeplum]
MSSGGVLSSGQANSGTPLTPTFQGYIGSTMDALVLFEACLNGRLYHVPRRPHDRERANLIVSGNVFIYEEHSSGIKRWTDGVPWSPSRILGNFLLYRELDKPFSPGEKKRATKRTAKHDGGITKSADGSRANSTGGFSSSIMAGGASMSGFDSATNGRDNERALIGSLVDSYPFKIDGLVKKTISVTYRGVQHHMVSYYSIDDVVNNRLRNPGDDPHLHGVAPRPSLISSGNFRAPVDDREYLVTDPSNVSRYINVPHPVSSYGMQSVPAARSMSMPSINPYSPTTWGNGQYGPAFTTTLPPIPTTYPAQPVPAYSYGQTVVSPYGLSSQASQECPPLEEPPPPRRHSNMHGTNGVGQAQYPSLAHFDRVPMNSNQLLTNGNGLGNHSLASQSYSNGAIYGTSAAAATHSSQQRDPYEHSNSNQHGDPYEHNNSNQHGDDYENGNHNQNGDPYEHSNPNQNGDVYGGGDSGHHSVRYQGHEENDFGIGTVGTVGPQVTTDFSAPLTDRSAHTFASSSQDTTPPTMQLSLDHSEPAPNGVTETEWTGGYVSNDTFQQLVTPSDAAHLANDGQGSATFGCQPEYGSSSYDYE